MKIGVVTNGALTFLSPNIPRFANKLNVSIWVRLNKDDIRRRDFIVSERVNVSDFMTTSIVELINYFFDSEGIEDGVECLGYGAEIYRWR